jgi:hypothetical protein
LAVRDDLAEVEAVANVVSVRHRRTEAGRDSWEVSGVARVPKPCDPTCNPMIPPVVNSVSVAESGQVDVHLDHDVVDLVLVEPREHPGGAVEQAALPTGKALVGVIDVKFRVVAPAA